MTPESDERQRPSSGADHTSRMAAFAELHRLNDEAMQALRQGRYDEQIRLYQEALRLVEEFDLGTDASLGIRRNLALAYEDAGRLAQAEARFRELLADPELPDDHRASVLHGLGTVLDQREDGEAAAVLRRAFDGYGNDARERLLAAIDLARHHLSRSDTAAARSVLEEALSSGGRAENALQRCRVHLTLVDAFVRSVALDEARSHLDRAHMILERQDDASPAVDALYLMMKAQVLAAEGRPGRARTLAVRALEQSLVDPDPFFFRDIVDLFNATLDAVTDAEGPA